MLITTQTGQLRIYKAGTLLPAPALDLGGRICTDQERGLMGVAVDPAFASNHSIYLFYTAKKGGTCEESTVSTANTPVDRVSRFTLGDDDLVDPASETVLIDNIPQPYGHHVGGDLAFGNDGYLYITSGDGSCDYAGNSGCWELNDAARDLSALVGKVLRITSNGDIPPTNPFQGTNTVRCNQTGFNSAGKICQEIYSSGLRNPFQFAFDPNTTATRFFINDTGQDTWEEIDLGQAGADYGWNVREGPCARGSATDCGMPPLGMTNPIHAYNHSAGCAAITGAAFVPAGVWPPQYDAAYLYEDLVCGRIFVLSPASGGGFAQDDLETGLESPISMSFGRYGATEALYYTTLSNPPGVRRLAYTGPANRGPVARATATPSYGPLPLTVHFDGSSSSDPDGGALTYDWDFGDGTPHSTSPAPSHSYPTAGTYSATLTVTDTSGASGTVTVKIGAGNTPPTPLIQSPAASHRFSVGEQLTLTGSASDAEEGSLPNTSLTWEVRQHHATHYHPFLPQTNGNNIQITAPAPEDLLAASNSYLEIRLTATDSKGLSTTVTRDVDPKQVDLTFVTDPSGLHVELAGEKITAPQTVTSWEGWRLPLDAPAQDGPGGSWAFSSWSDGGSASHSAATPSGPTTYTATFAPYYHPIGTTALRVALVPVFRPCETGAANSSHGVPLRQASCNPPLPASSTVRVGARSVGFARAVVCSANSASRFCNPAGGVMPRPDVRLTGSIRDVKCAPALPPGQTACVSPGADYNPNGAPGPYSSGGNGNRAAAAPACFPSATSDSACIAGADLTEVAQLPHRPLGATGTRFQGNAIRVTDLRNGARLDQAGTMVDVGFPIPLDCIPTADTTLGSTCGVNTTANALVPGVAVAGKGATWQIGQIGIRDAGPDGARGNDDDQLFATQGVFVP